jgi:hypothetical protein
MLTQYTGSMIFAGFIAGLICLSLAIWSLYTLEDTFHKDLDYYEE